MHSLCLCCARRGTSRSKPAREASSGSSLLELTLPTSPLPSCAGAWMIQCNVVAFNPLRPVVKHGAFDVVERTISDFSLVLAWLQQLGIKSKMQQMSPRQPELQAALAAVCRLVAMALGPITTHALNTATGRPAENLQVTLKQATCKGRPGEAEI